MDDPETIDTEPRSGNPKEAGAVPIPVVAIGGSAGSIEALEVFFQNAPADGGAAYVVVVHLLPDHESSLADILQRCTEMPVTQVSGRLQLEADHVYVIPPSRHLVSVDGSLALREIDAGYGRRNAVDLFFRTLADTHGPLASAIVLSGMDGDGALGLKRVKERGGLTIAQDPDEAEQDGMPRAAIATGTVDWVLRVAEMPARLAEYRENGRRLDLPSEERSERAAERNDEALREVLDFLKIRSGHDFSYYKRATVVRRLGRRMQVNGCADMPGYLSHLRTHAGEAGALLQDLLISVTNFFRDAEAFTALQQSLPTLFRGKGPDDQLRVWVPGCATGEEAYSLAMLLSEHAAKLEAPPQIQIFATDIDQAAIDVARFGLYPETIATDVSEDRLRRFFTKESAGYRVRRSVRELVLFARHDLLKDSPFSRLDLISCRNLLIYLERSAQQRAFDIFHFALLNDGLLFLGFSESAEEAAPLFRPLSKKHRIYARCNAPRGSFAIPLGAPRTDTGGHHVRDASLRAPSSAAPLLSPAVNTPRSASSRVPAPPGNPMAALHFRLLERLAPPSMVVDSEYEIVHLSEGASQFIRFTGGEPTMNAIRAIDPGLRTELRAALFQAAKTAEPVESLPVVWEEDGRKQLLKIAVHPPGEEAEDLYLVLFRCDEPGGGEPLQPTVETRENSDVVRHLEEELDKIRTQWRQASAHYETTTEDLQASNEELQAMNEEMRSATEELETGREELQSVNEELTTVNLELKTKVEELSRANSDLQNLMASTSIATLFLDRELTVQRYTPSALKLFNMIPSDIGRPLSHVTHQLDYPAMLDDARRVLKDLSPVEREIRTTEGEWYLARLLPYRTLEDRIGGVVLTCIDITERKKGEESRRWLSAMVESSNDAILSFSMTGEIISWNRGAEKMFGYSAEEIVGRSQAMLAGPEHQEEKKQLLEILKRDEAVPGFETVRIRKDGTRIDVSLSASVMRDEHGEIVGATAIAQDITERKRAVAELRDARDELEQRVEQRTEELRNRAEQLRRMASQLTRGEQRERLRMSRLLHDHVQQLLVSAKMRLETLVRIDGETQREEIRAVAAMLQDTLVSARSLAVDLSPPVLHEGLPTALEWLGSVWMKNRHGLNVHLDLDPAIDAISEELRALVYLAVREILFNVVKHADVDEAHLKLSPEGTDKLRVEVRDHGTGFDMALVEADRMMDSGLGLAGLRERVEMAGGELTISSVKGDGVAASIVVPARRIEADKEAGDDR